MDTAAIRTRIKELISNVSNIPVEEIADDAHFRDDLDLDSLAMLEIGVDVDYEYRLGVEDLDDRIGELPRVQDVVDLVEEILAARSA